MDYIKLTNSDLSQAALNEDATLSHHSLLDRSVLHIHHDVDRHHHQECIKCYSSPCIEHRHIARFRLSQVHPSLQPNKMRVSVHRSVKECKTKADRARKMGIERRAKKPTSRYYVPSCLLSLVTILGPFPHMCRQNEIEKPNASSSRRSCSRSAWCDLEENRRLFYSFASMTPALSIPNVASASGSEGDAMIFAMRVSPRPFFTHRRVVVA